MNQAQKTLDRFCSNVFQPAWDERYTQLMKEVGGDRRGMKFEEIHKIHKSVIARMSGDTAFIDSITHPHGIGWRLFKDGGAEFEVFLLDA